MLLDYIALNISAVILNFNNWRDTLACVKSVLASEYPLSRVVIVDNGSTDDSAQRVRDWAAETLNFTTPKFGGSANCLKPYLFVELADGDEGEQKIPHGRVVLLRSKQNGGYAAGNNKAIKLLMSNGADAVWILNNDTVVDRKAIGFMVERLYSKARPGLCGARVQYCGTDIVQCRGGGTTNRLTGLSTLDGHKLRTSKALAEPSEAVERRINFIYGACVLADRRFIETVGLMDDRYFLYCEEQDWAYSAKGRFDFAYAAEALVYHKEGASTGLSGVSSSLLQLWRLTRSRILLTVKHTPLALPSVFLCIVFAAFRMAWRRSVLKTMKTDT
jgi:GT2 family glycosyltransferase